MKRTTSFVRNFHFGNTIKFMANKMKEFIIYTAECMRAYFGICDKKNSRWKITHRKIISTPLLRKIHYADRKLTISSHTRFVLKINRKKENCIFDIGFTLETKQFLTFIRFQEKGNYPPTMQCYLEIVSVIRQSISFEWTNSSLFRFTPYELIMICF